MKVIVDTSIWSCALRRGSQDDSAAAQELRRLIHDHRVQMLGPVRQEILSGIRHEAQFNRLNSYLTFFPDLSIISDDHVAAARFFNRCRAEGIQGSNTNFLICAVAVRNKMAIFSADKDFESFARIIPIELHIAEKLSPRRNT
jgi:hypothetical protein